MAWSHSHYITEPTLKDRERVLRLHIQEVQDKIEAKIMSDGTAFDPTPLNTYLDRLDKKLDSMKGGGSKLTRGRIIKL